MYIFICNIISPGWGYNSSFQHNEIKTCNFMHIYNLGGISLAVVSNWRALFVILFTDIQMLKSAMITNRRRQLYTKRQRSGVLLYLYDFYIDGIAVSALQTWKLFKGIVHLALSESTAYEDSKLLCVNNKSLLAYEKYWSIKKDEQ